MYVGAPTLVWPSSPNGTGFAGNVKGFFPWCIQPGVAAAEWGVLVRLWGWTCGANSHTCPGTSRDVAPHFLNLYHSPSGNYRPPCHPAGCPADFSSTKCATISSSLHLGLKNPAAGSPWRKEGLGRQHPGDSDSVILLQLGDVAPLIYWEATIGKQSMNGRNLLGSWVNLYFILIIKCVA